MTDYFLFRIGETGLGRLMRRDLDSKEKKEARRASTR